MNENRHQWDKKHLAIEAAAQRLPHPLLWSGSRLKAGVPSKFRLMEHFSECSPNKKIALMLDLVKDLPDGEIPTVSSRWRDFLIRSVQNRKRFMSLKIMPVLGNHPDKDQAWHLSLWGRIRLLSESQQVSLWRENKKNILYNARSLEQMPASEMQRWRKWIK